jgi:uncharacterized membrane protein YphA (DoxX/SURF4 family)
MLSITPLIQWIEERKEISVDLIRIYLGIALFIRGYLFLGQPQLLTEALSEAGAQTDSALMYLIAWIHMGGGVLLAIGLLTRVAALIQLPILIVAVFGVHLQQGLADTSQSLELSALVLFLLLIILIRGSGPFSIDALVLKSADSTLPDLPPDVEIETIGDITIPLIRSTDEIDLDSVRPKPVFERTGWIRLILGVPTSPVAVDYVSRDTGEVVARTRNPEILVKFR